MAPRIHQGSSAYLADGERPVLTIGNFDGVHLGHRALLKRLVDTARERGAPACVYTFEPAPRRVLQPDRCPPRILDLDDRIRRLGQLGVDEVILEEFTIEFAEKPALWFAQEVLGERIRPQAMVVGHDFRYGRSREGDVSLLAEQLPGLPIEAVEPAVVGGIVASSSRIREAVAEGRVADAAALLGRPYSLRGVITPGDRRGRDLGFPTANLNTTAELLPAAGVYAVRCGGEIGVANLGVRPTFDGRRFQIETHLLDWSGDLYDRPFEVQFVARIRGERRFEGPEALVAQIRADVEAARAILGPR